MIDHSVWKQTLSLDKSMVKVHDILVHTFTLPSQRIYRVGAIRLGGTDEEGHVELEPLGYTSDMPLCVPHLMLDHMLKSGIVKLAWRKE